MNDIKIFLDSRGWIDQLIVDLQIAQKTLSADESQTSRRACIRALFALIEGDLAIMKQGVLSAVEDDTFSLSVMERALLQEEGYELDTKGRPRITKKFIRLQDNIRFTFPIFAKAYNCDFVLNVSDDGWSSLIEAIKIRNRVTHPKCANDLMISDDALKTVRTASLWYLRSGFRLLTSIKV